MAVEEAIGAEAVVEGARKVTGKDVPGLLHLQNELLGKVLERLNRLPEGLRQSLADHLWAEIPSTFEEYGYAPSATQASSTTQTQGSVRRVESIYTFCGGNQTGWLQIGNSLVIPVPAGGQNLTDTTLLLRDGDARTLFLGTPGAQSSTPALCFFALFGRILPRFGEFT